MTQLAWEVPVVAKPHPALTCGAVGSKDDWKKWRQQYPRCNRPESHEGPHRVYNRRAEVLAEWITQPSGAPSVGPGSPWSSPSGASHPGPTTPSPDPRTSASSSPTDDGAAS